MNDVTTKTCALLEASGSATLAAEVRKHNSNYVGLNCIIKINNPVRAIFPFVCSLISCISC